MWAAVRHVGTEIRWDNCKTKNESGKEVIDDGGVTCNILDDEVPLNCKLRPGENGIC